MCRCDEQFPSETNPLNLVCSRVYKFSEEKHENETASIDNSTTGNIQLSSDIQRNRPRPLFPRLRKLHKPSPKCELLVETDLSPLFDITGAFNVDVPYQNFEPLFELSNETGNKKTRIDGKHMSHIYDLKRDNQEKYRATEALNTATRKASPLPQT